MMAVSRRKEGGFLKIVGNRGILAVYAMRKKILGIRKEKTNMKLGIVMEGRRKQDNFFLRSCRCAFR